MEFSTNFFLYRQVHGEKEKEKQKMTKAMRTAVVGRRNVDKICLVRVDQEGLTLVYRNRVISSMSQ